MLMTVFERTHEISVLLAVGWTRGRIMRMILYESALLGLFGGIVGVAIGAIGVKVLSATPAIRGLLQPDLSIALLGTFCRHRRRGRNYQRTLSRLAEFAAKSRAGFASRMRAAQINRSMRNYPGAYPLSVKLFFASPSPSAFCLISIHAAEPAPAAMSAAELADRLNAVSQGNALIRSNLRCDHWRAPSVFCNFRSSSAGRKPQPILFIKCFGLTNTKGEAVILHQAQGARERLDHRSAATSSRDQVLANGRGIVRQ